MFRFDLKEFILRRGLRFFSIHWGCVDLHYRLSNKNGWRTRTKTQMSIRRRGFIRFLFDRDRIHQFGIW